MEIHGNLDLNLLSAVPDHVVTELTIRRATDSDTGDPADIDLHGLEHFRRLERLILAPCPGFVDLSPLAHIPTLREIVIREAALVTGASRLPRAEIDSAVALGD
ncbi:hypothetical protein [Streptomyces mirabilis]|uniref:hypothetical protein n=1 Tax=Streptomyces mirabilis TaxID=68239 RepID=UPI0036B51D9D